MKKRFLAGLLTLVMIVSLVPMPALAVEDDTVVVPCTKTEGCILADGHEGDCVLPAEPEEDEGGIMLLGADDDTDKSGSCGAEGSDVKWELTVNNDDTENPTYTLTISGSGEMPGFSSTPAQPWLSTNNENRDKITAIVVNEGITSIGARSFRQLTSVKTLSLPASLQEISAPTALELLTSLESVSVASGSKYFKAVDGVLFSVDGKTLVKYPENKSDESYAVPSGTEIIADMAFENLQNLKEIALNNGLQSIGQFAFSASNKITSIVIPDSVTCIEEYAFYNNTGLKSIVIGSGVTEIAEYMFQVTSGNTSALETVTLAAGSNITSIGKYAFDGCKKLTSLSLAEDLQTIGNYAFRNCEVLASVSDTSVTFAKLESIGESAFQNCEKLLDFPLSYETPLNSVGKFAFKSTGLTSITIPNSLETISEEAFSYCYDMKSANISENSKLESVEQKAFYLTCLSKVRLPGTITNIGSDAFKMYLDGASNYAIFDMSNIGPTVTIGNGAFMYTQHTGDIKQSKDVLYVANDQVCSKFTADVCSLYMTIFAITNGGTFEDNSDFNNTALTKPAKSGFIFEGWYYEESGAEKEVIDNTTLAGNTKYYAKWTESSYTVESSIEFNGLSYGDTPEGKEISVDLKAGATAGTGTLSAVSDSKNFTVEAGNDTITVTPANNLDAGTYEATITITTPDGATHNVSVSLTITKATLTAPVLSGYTATTTSITVTEPAIPTGASKVLYSIDNGANWLDNNVFSGLTSGTTYSVIAKFVANDSGNYADSASSIKLSAKTNSPASGSTTYTVAVDSTKNGTITVSPKNASKGATVTITVKANDGYELDTLTVTDKNGDTVKVTHKSDTQYTFTMPASKVTVAASFAKIEEQPSITFIDVPTSAYYYDAVAWAVENGITNGTSDTTFSPDATCTRAQTVTFLWRAAGSPAPKSSVNPFTDVQPGAYYYEAVLWAVENGITNGTSATTFSPDLVCDRAQIVTFLYRADGTATTGSNPFTDVANSAYYAPAVQWAVANGITNGTSSTTFSPDTPCTRGQIVTFLYRDMAE